MSDAEMPALEAIVFDIGRVLIQWDLRHLFAQLITDEEELDWFLSHVVTEQWHFEHDAGRPLAEMVPERKAQFPQYSALIDAYATRFNDTIPGPVPGSESIVDDLVARGWPLFAITNFGADFWPDFLPTAPVLGHFRDIVVSGVERMAKPDPAIFRLAERRFGFAAPAMLFIDDNVANIAAAQTEGWQVHHFRNAAGRRGYLGERGILPA